jgi:internalin A
MQLIQKITIFIGILISAVAVNAAPRQPNKVKNFDQWCQEQKSLPVATAKTIEVLLKKAVTDDCRVADSRLRALTVLDLSNNQISDVQPLASLNNLTKLDLSKNQINDLHPLVTLHSLTALGLNGNQISDISPLASFVKLTVLNLSKNKISDIKPLAILNTLTDLGH